MSSEDAPISFTVDPRGGTARGPVVAASHPSQREDAGVEMAASSSSNSSERRDSIPQSRRRASDLPDLRPRLVSAGVYEDYLNFRTKYLNWRRGSHSGASGELTDVGTRRQAFFVQQQQPHVDLVDTPQQFNFFYTTSYWVAILTTVGSLVLSFTNITPLFDRTVDPVVMKWLLLLGDIFFTLSTYAKYFELINLPNSEQFWFFWLRWTAIVGEQNIVPESAIGITAYLLGMLIWDVAAVAEFWEWEGLDEWALILGPRLGGGICFMIGGVCEVVHNRNQPCLSAEWIAAVFDFLGCIGFLVGVFSALVPAAALVAAWSYAFGILGFLVGGVFMIVMWRSNDFGLTLLRQLNDALRAGGPVTLTSADSGRVLLRHGGSPIAPLPRAGEREEQEEEEEAEEDERGMSMRGVVFLTIYCWLFACSSMNVVLRCYQEHFWAAVENGSWLMIVMLVLLVHSAITGVPNRQPYYLVMILSRFVLGVAAVTQTRHFLTWIPRES